MNKINESKDIVIKNENLEIENNNNKSVTDNKSRQLADKETEKVKVDKLNDYWQEREWGERKSWELEFIFRGILTWFKLETLEHELYQKEGKFIYELNDYMNKNINYDRQKKEWKKLEIANYIDKKQNSSYCGTFAHNEKTKQLLMNLVPQSECKCNNLGEWYCSSPCRSKEWCVGKTFYHVKNCLKTEKEFEEYIQKIIKNFKEALRELERTILKEKGVVWDYKDQQVDDYFWNHSIQNKRSLIKSINGTYFFEGSYFSNRSALESNELLKEWIEQKELIIEQKKKQSAKKLVNKRETTDRNDTEKSEIILDEKEHDRTVKKSNDGGIQKSSTNKITKSENNDSYLVSAGLPVAIILVVVISYAFWISQKRKNFKRNKKNK